ARAEMLSNPRYIWRDDVPRTGVRRLLARSHAMVISSLSEGGANVISEAVVAGVPILASRMDGNVGLLGADYPGYFPVGAPEGLPRLLWGIEADARFVARLRRAITRRAPLFKPEREVAAWRKLLAELPRESRDDDARFSVLHIADNACCGITISNNRLEYYVDTLRRTGNQQ